MLNSISFMGREECLTKPAKKVIEDKTHEYLRPDSNVAFNEIISKTKEDLKAVAEKESKAISEAFRTKNAPIEMNPNAKENLAKLGNEWATAHYGSAIV